MDLFATSCRGRGALEVSGIIHRAHAVKISQEDLERAVVEAGLSPENARAICRVFFLTATLARWIRVSSPGAVAGIVGRLPFPAAVRI